MTTGRFVVGRFLFRPDSVPPKEESGEIRPFLSPRIVRCFRFFCCVWVPHVETDACRLVSAAVAAFIAKWLCAITLSADGVSQ